MDMRARFGMDGDDIGPGLGKRGDERIDRGNHQVNIERLGGVRTQRLNHHRADREVGHEMPVHHIDMNPVRPGGITRAHFFAETGEVSGQDRRGNQRWGHGTIGHNNGAGWGNPQSFRFPHGFDEIAWRHEQMNAVTLAIALRVGLR